MKLSIGNIIPEMKRFPFFLFALAFFCLTSLNSGLAQTFYSPGAAVAHAVTILKNEITRDDEILSAPLNNIRLRMARNMIATGIKQKRNLINNFARLKAHNLSSAINILSQTLANEESIVKSRRTIVAVRLRTGRIIRNNVKLKRAALAQFEKWLENSNKR